MNKNFLTLSILIVLYFLTQISIGTNETAINQNESVADVLEKLGAPEIPHQAKSQMASVSAQIGEDLVLRGITTSNKGKKSKQQSKHFVCTSCHNIEKEDPDLSKADPQARLEYVSKKGLPFLQGTSLYGAVNRTSFYNGDYDKKYGELVKPARNDIREAIQLCAVECAQGRPLKNWELESVLAYLWTLELRMKDLDIEENEWATINRAISKKKDKATAIEMIENKYLKASPATFVTPPSNRKKGYELKGNADNGALIYEHSCLHCHEEARYSYFHLDEATLTLNHLEKHISKYSRYSIYQVGRWGTPSMNGKKAYMPQYTLEKMSNQQMEDLRAYIEQH